MPVSTHIALADFPNEMPAQIASRSSGVFIVGAPFFLPGILALAYAGFGYAAESWRIAEHSTVTADGPPVYHFKTVIPIAGTLVMLQGLAEIVRCFVCLRTGAWPARLEDVEEIDVIETQLSHSEFIDEESRQATMKSAHAIDEAARHRSSMDIEEQNKP